MLPAKSAILVHLKTIGIVLLVFDGVVIALFALCACHCNFYSHLWHLLIFGILPSAGLLPRSKDPPSASFLCFAVPFYKDAQSFARLIRTGVKIYAQKKDPRRGDITITHSCQKVKNYFYDFLKLVAILLWHRHILWFYGKS